MEKQFESKKIFERIHTMKPNYSIDIAINCFRPGGGMESYTFDLVRGLNAHGIKPTVFAAQIDTTIPEYRQVDTHHIN